MLITMPVAPGDILVLGSDGLFDNVSDAELVAAVEGELVQGEHGLGGLGLGRGWGRGTSHGQGVRERWDRQQLQGGLSQRRALAEWRLQPASGRRPLRPPAPPRPRPAAPTGHKAPVIAQRLAFLAFENSMDREKETPFRWAWGRGLRERGSGMGGCPSSRPRSHRALALSSPCLRLMPPVPPPSI